MAVKHADEVVEAVLSEYRFGVPLTRAARRHGVPYYTARKWARGETRVYRDRRGK